jgi:hypothetical protein
MYQLTALAFVAMLTIVSPAMAETPTFTITIKNHTFSPTTLEVPAETKFKLIVVNDDPSAEEFESYELNREKIIAGNSKGTVHIGPLKAGTYPYFGEFNQATAQGKIIAK